jgi:hypothetical protein
VVGQRRFSIARRLGNQAVADMQPPLFILAPPRSFTSVTCAMFGNHPQMFGLPETNLFTVATMRQLIRTYRSRYTAEHGLLRAIAELCFQEQSDESVEAAKLWLRENLDMSTGEIFRTMAEWAAP